MYYENIIKLEELKELKIQCDVKKIENCEFLQVFSICYENVVMMNLKKKEKKNKNKI